jgi:hypothetical protein
MDSSSLLSQTYDEIVSNLCPHLCLQCLIRKELYVKIQQSMPRSLRQSLAMKWPFLPLDDTAPPLTHTSDIPTNSNTNSNTNNHPISSIPSTVTNSYNNTANNSLNVSPMNHEGKVFFGDSYHDSDQHHQQQQQQQHMPLSIEINLGYTSSLSHGYGSSSSFQPHIHNGTGNSNDNDIYSIVSGSTLSSLFSPGMKQEDRHLPILPYQKLTKSPLAKSSPLASHKLALLDEYESELLYQQQSSSEALQFFDFKRHEENDDDYSLNDSVSQLSVEDDHSLQLKDGMIITAKDGRYGGSLSLESQTTISTISIVNPLKKPKELTLLPYLLSKGHYEEVERMIRILLAKPAIDEGEGVLQLLKILSYQADMYKSMGLFPLAVAIYLDITDITASLLGITDYITKKAISLVCLCYHKMQKSSFSEQYMNALTNRILVKLKKDQRIQMIEQFHELNR